MRPLIALAAALLVSACRGKAAPSEPAFQVSAHLASEVSSGKPAELLTRIAAGPGFKLNKVPFTATQVGKQRISGILAFSVCNPDTCLIEKQKVAVEVDVR